MAQDNSPVGGTFTTGASPQISATDYACNGGACDVSFPVTYGSWVPLKYNFTQPAGIEFYANNTKVHTDTDNDGLNFIFFLSANFPGIFYIDDFYCYNGETRPEAAPVFTPPTIDLLLPEMNNLYNNDPLPVDYVGEAVDGFNKTEIYVNGTLNKTLSTLTNTTIEIGEGLYDITVGITDSNGAQTNDTNTGITVDRTSPSDDLATVLPLGTQFFSDYILNVTATDDNLYGHNVSIFNAGGDLIDSQELINISTQTNTFSFVIDISSYGAGTFTVISNESDDHTAKKIPKYKVTPSVQNKKINFNHDGQNVEVNVKSAKQGNAKMNLNAISHSKKYDRYKFGFEFNPKGGLKTYVFEVKTTEDYYIRNTHYSAHVVSGNQWIDFEPYTAVVTPINSRTYEVTIETTDNELTFESIGGVNIQTTTSTFIIENPLVSGFLCDGSTCSSLFISDDVNSWDIQCQYATSANISVQQAGTEITQSASVPLTLDGAIQLYQHSFAHTLNGSAYLVEFACINDVTAATSSVSFTPTAAPVPVPEPTLANFKGDIFAKTLITILIAILIFFVIRREMTSKGGAR